MYCLRRMALCTAVTTLAISMIFAGIAYAHTAWYTNVTETSISLSYTDPRCGHVLRNETLLVYQGGASSCTDTGLTPNTPYFYKVEWYGLFHVHTDSYWTPTKYTLAKVPTSLGVTGVTATTVSLTWDANGNPANTQYEIYCNTTGQTVGTSTTTSFTHTGATPSTVYSYKVRAVNGDGVATAYTSDVSARTLVAVPSLLTATGASTTSVLVSWNANGNPAGTVYELYCNTAGTTLYTGANTSYTHTGRAVNTMYSYKVRARNVYNEYSSYSEDRTGYTLANTPTSLAASGPATTSMLLSWSANGNPAGTTYELYCNTTGTTIYAGTGTAYSHTGLTPGRIYSYKVRAKNGDGVPTSYTPDVTKSTLCNMPALLAATAATQTSVSLSWDANGNHTDGTYELYCNTTGTTIYAGGGTSYTHTGLSPGTTYSYKVRAKNADGQYTLYTSDATKITIPPTPAKPTGTCGALSWSNDANNRGRGYTVVNWVAVTGAAGYKLWVYDGAAYRAFDVGNVLSWDSRTAKIFPTDAELRTYADNSVTTDIFKHDKTGRDLPDTPNLLYRKCGTTYYDTNDNYAFRVSAYNASGESPYSDDAYAPTLPNRTDTAAPQVVSLDVVPIEHVMDVRLRITYNDPLVQNYTTSADDDASNIYKYKLSNDGMTFKDVDSPNKGQSGTEEIIWSRVEAGAGAKTVYVKAVDLAGNESTVEKINLSYVVDAEPPEVTLVINNGQSYTRSSTVTVSIEALDNFTTPDKLEYRIGLDGQNWKRYDPAQAGEKWVNADTTWGQCLPLDKPDFNIGATEGKKYIFVQVRDENRNVKSVVESIIYVGAGSTPAMDSIEVTGEATTDKENLNGKIIENGELRMMVIQGDTVSIQLQNMEYVSDVYTSFDGINWSTGEKPDSSENHTKSITFLSQGKKAVFIKLKNSEGGESLVFKRNYLVDYTPPVVSVKTKSGDRATTDNNIELQIKASDNVSPVTSLKYSIKVNNGAYSGYTSIPSTGVIAPALAAGRNVFVIKVVDEAGNIAQDTITVWKL